MVEDPGLAPAVPLAEPGGDCGHGRHCRASLVAAIIGPLEGLALYSSSLKWDFPGSTDNPALPLAPGLPACKVSWANPPVKRIRRASELP